MNGKNDEQAYAGASDMEQHARYDYRSFPTCYLRRKCFWFFSAIDVDVVEDREEEVGNKISDPSEPLELSASNPESDLSSSGVIVAAASSDDNIITLSDCNFSSMFCFVIASNNRIAFFSSAYNFLASSAAKMVWSGSSLVCGCLYEPPTLSAHVKYCP